MISGALEGTVCSTSAAMWRALCRQLARRPGLRGHQSRVARRRRHASRAQSQIRRLRTKFPRAQSKQEERHTQSARKKGPGDFAQTIGDRRYLDRKLPPANEAAFGPGLRKAFEDKPEIDPLFDLRLWPERALSRQAGIRHNRPGAERHVELGHRLRPPQGRRFFHHGSFLRDLRGPRHHGRSAGPPENRARPVRRRFAAASEPGFYRVPCRRLFERR